MTQEEENLLIKDLCSRLPYRVKVTIFPRGVYTLEYLYQNTYYNDYRCCVKEKTFNPSIRSNEVKPYLFPMSSMTEEQKIQYYQTLREFDNTPTVRTLDWLNAHHFDYRGLIDKGLAIDATNLNIY